LRTPGLELNDIGFQTSSDRMIPFVWVQYREDKPSDTLLNWQANTDVFDVNNFEPLLLTYGLEANATAQFANYWQGNVYVNLANNKWDPIALRGGPALRANPNVQSNAQLTSDNRKRVWVTANLHGALDWTSYAENIGLDLGATIQARSNIDLYAGPSFYIRNDPLQYIAEADDTTGAHHYVFGTVHQTTTSLTTRANWTFSPHLSLQIYAQPFIAAGRYSEYKDVDNPHAERFADRFHVLQDREYTIAPDNTVHVAYAGSYSFDRPDFDLRQIRSTIVLRWEYRPGSTVFAIWSHGQTSQLDDGRFQLGRDAAGLFTAAAQNLVMIKVNYWIGL
jgi:hypothetical protein